jgi:hypothetical protein
MATNKKITELTELTEASLADNDVLPIVDISEGTTHKVRKSTLAAALSGVSQVEATSPIAVDQTTGEVTVSISSTPSFGTVDLTADTSAGDNAAIGYTAAEGLILTGQGSTNDVTIKNDADADVLEIPTGTTNVTVVGSVTAASLAGSGSGLTAGTTPITTLDIDGGTDIGEAIVDADLFIVDNGAGGTNRKMEASRIKTYVGGYTDPLTTRGDVVKRGASATERLAIGSANTVLTTDGTDPAWSTVTNSMLAGSIANSKLVDIDLTSKVTGVLPVANGGSGASSLADGNVLLGSGTGAITALDATAKGSVIVGDGTTDPVALAVGSNDHVLTADSSTASGLKWAAGGADFTGIASDVTPDGDATRDLGSAAAEWDQVYMRYPTLWERRLNIILLGVLNSGGTMKMFASGHCWDPASGNTTLNPDMNDSVVGDFIPEALDASTGFNSKPAGYKASDTSTIILNTDQIDSGNFIGQVITSKLNMASTYDNVQGQFRSHSLNIGGTTAYRPEVQLWYNGANPLYTDTTRYATSNYTYWSVFFYAK